MSSFLHYEFVMFKEMQQSIIVYSVNHSSCTSHTRLITRMRSFVFNEGSIAYETFITDIADIRLLSSVRTSVFNEYDIPTECLITYITDVWL